MLSTHFKYLTFMNHNMLQNARKLWNGNAMWLPALNKKYKYSVSEKYVKKDSIIALK